MLREIVLNERLRQPGKLEDVSQSSVRMLGAMPIDQFRRAFPETDPGPDKKNPNSSLFEEKWKKRNAPFLLDEELVDYALFAGQENFEGLERYFRERLENLGRFSQYDQKVGTILNKCGIN